MHVLIFFETISKISHKRSRDSLKTRHKKLPRFFQIKYFKNKVRNPRDIYFQTMYFKNKTQGVPEILLNYFKNQTQWVPEILSNYFKKQARRLRNSFKLLQKHDNESPRQDKGTPRFFLTTSKRKHKGVPEIPATYFKKKIHREVLPNYSKNQTQGAPEILSNYFKIKIRNPRDSFKIFQK